MTHYMVRAQQPRHRVHGITGSGTKTPVSSHLAHIGLKDHSILNSKTHYMSRDPPSCHRTPPLIGKTPTPQPGFSRPSNQLQECTYHQLSSHLSNSMHQPRRPKTIKRSLNLTGDSSKKLKRNQIQQSPMALNSSRIGASTIFYITTPFGHT